MRAIVSAEGRFVFAEMPAPVRTSPGDVLIEVE